MASGSTITLAAHAYAVEGSDYVFSLLMEGDPCVEVEIARIPTELVASISGG